MSAGLSTPLGADLGAPTVLVLVRHARTSATEQGRFSGHGGADPGLSAAGVREADRLAVRLARFGPGPVATVVSSPLARSRATATAIATRFDLPVVVDPAWTEADFGRWEGLTFAEVAAGWPERLGRWRESWAEAPPGGQSLAEVADRMLAARDRLVTAHPGQVVVVVTHLTGVRVVTCAALDAGPAAWWRLAVAPASVSVIRFWADGGVEVAAVNDTAHLRPEPS